MTSLHLYLLEVFERLLVEQGHRHDVVRAVTRPTYEAWKPPVDKS